MKPSTITGPAVRALVCALVLAAFATLVVAPHAARAACVDVSATYPGDAAPKPDIAAWMAGGASRAGFPAELPVMAALVESDLTNDPGGDADSVGYFQMRAVYWNSGPYAGYATNPPLQLQWFIDQAGPAEKGRAADATQWGQWIADIERPAAQYRDRYQLRLADAQALIAPGCSGALSATTPGGGLPAPVDTRPPRVRVTGPAHQNVQAQRSVLVGVRCPAETCVATATAKVTGSGLKKPVTTSAHVLSLKPNQPGSLRLPISVSLRRLAARAAARGKPLLASVTVSVADINGNRAVSVVGVRLAPKR